MPSLHLADAVLSDGATIVRASRSGASGDGVDLFEPR
jgi:hypothetical protein